MSERGEIYRCHMTDITMKTIWRVTKVARACGRVVEIDTVGDNIVLRAVLPSRAQREIVALTKDGT